MPIQNFNRPWSKVQNKDKLQQKNICRYNHYYQQTYIDKGVYDCWQDNN